jgi:hypothetical protein
MGKKRKQASSAPPCPLIAVFFSGIVAGPQLFRAAVIGVDKYLDTKYIISQMHFVYLPPPAIYNRIIRWLSTNRINRTKNICEKEP